MVTHIENFDAAEGVAVVPAFGRSETFHPRYGWLKKGFDAAVEDPSVFTRPDATTVLGVGKNMVRAIRYWCHAYKVLSAVPNSDNPRLQDATTTRFGQLLFDDQKGLDPYLEDPGSLWLLHWELLRPPCRAPAWFAIFNGVRAAELNDQTLGACLRLFCDARPDWEVAESSLKKDARCLLRMYASVTEGRDFVEDTIDSPFTDLDLIRSVPGDRGHYTFNISAKPSLPDAVVVYACLDFMGREETQSQTLSLARLAGAPGSPGNCFKLTEAALAEAIDRYSEQNESIALIHAAGTPQLAIDGPPDDLAQRVLKRHYRRGRRS